MDTPSDSSVSGKSKCIHLFERNHCSLALALGLWLAVFANIGSHAATRFVPGQILVKPRANAVEADFIARLNRRGAVTRGPLRHSKIHIVSVAEVAVDATLTALRNDPEIEFAERDYLAEVTYLPNDPLVVSGTEWHLAQIQTPAAWDITRGANSTVIAVLDSGVNAAQPDLAGRILPGFDFVNNDSDPADDYGHGTAVAGTLVAIGNNGIGVAGVAFGCRVLPVKVVNDSGFASYSCMAQGIRYAVDSGARVINLSIAGSAPSATLQDAVNYAWNHNVVVVASAGNNGNSTAQYPAACEHVIAVSATEPDNSLATFSTFGSFVSLAAPGDNIWTTQRTGKPAYAAWSGTSFASPIVAGVAALVISANPTLPNSKVVSILEQNADDLGTPGFDPQFGFGCVNARRAVLAASVEPGALPPNSSVDPGMPGDPVLSDTQAPLVTIDSAPKNNARLLTPDVMLAGSAKDDSSVAKVELRVNGIEQPVSGTTQWTAQLSLSPGVNVVKVRSIDSAGNFSSEGMRILNYIETLPASVKVNGSGWIKPDINGKLLEVGEIYSIKAFAAPGQAFAGWSGVNSQSAELNFTMQPGLALVAKFVPSPFPAVAGNYAGLISNTNGVVPGNSGGFNLSVTTGGKFSGKLALGGKRRGFRGQFDLAGRATVTLNRTAEAPLRLSLVADLTGGSDQVTGEVTDGAWVSQLAGDRNIFDSKSNPAQQAGSRPFVLEQAEAQAATAATGLSRIATSGSTRVKGRLSDGRPFSAGSLLAKNGDCPLYVPLNRGSEVVIGWLNFPSSPAATASGTVLWVRSGTNAFAATLKANSLP